MGARGLERRAAVIQESMDLESYRLLDDKEQESEQQFKDKFRQRSGTVPNLDLPCDVVCVRPGLFNNEVK